MRSVKSLLAAGAASILSTAAFAADLPIAAPPMYAPPPPAEFSGWYLRGDIGMSNQQAKDLTLTSVPFPAGFQTTGLGFDSAPIFDVGVGYQFNNWFRMDVTGQYRGKANFHGSQTIFDGSNHLADNYSGSKSESVVLVNAYADLGTWWCITPFVGAGVGMSYNQISSFRDDGFSSTFNVANAPAITYFDDHGQWNFAWAVHAGLAYKVTPSLTMELAYSYMNLGDASPGNFAAYDGSISGATSFRFKDITSHDLKLGVRWAIDPMPAYQPPLITKG
jgi:opacity protein-like surface antigen